MTDAGYNVVGEAELGKTGIELAKSLKPDLITLDVVLPDMTGIEVLRTIKENDPEMPVLMVTGLGQANVRELALHYNATGIITKPIDEDVLIEKLNRIFRNNTTGV